jgi:DNA-binding NarL/FixJ family response regulator
MHTEEKHNFELTICFFINIMINIMKNIKIILVDKNSIFLNIMKSFFENVLGCKIIGIASNGEAFNTMKNLDEADIIFMDIEMSGINGFQSVVKIFEKLPEAKIIAVSMYNDPYMQNQLMKLGFKGFISKTKFYYEVVPAIKKVLRNGVYVAN